MENCYSISGTSMMESNQFICQSCPGCHFIIGSFSWAIHQLCKMCGVWQGRELSAFPSEITKRYHTPQLEILGAPIGNEEFCNNFVINKQSSVSFLLQQLQG